MTKKSLAVLLSAAMMVSVLAGCGGADNSTSDNSQTQEAANTETADAAETAEPEADGAEAGGDQIVLKVFDAHAYGLDEYAEMVEAFEKDHPGVTIEVQHAANDSNTLLQSRVNSGDVPDVFDVESGTSAKAYYEYAYDWTNDTDVTDLFNADALETDRKSVV